jgi:DNA end-binding protein Ku
MAQQLIDTLSNEFDPSKYRDEYRDRVLDLIERKASGEEIAAAPQAEEETPAPDLMAALEASLAAVRSGSSDEPEAGSNQKPPARKRAAKSSKSPAKAKAKS